MALAIDLSGRARSSAAEAELPGGSLVSSLCADETSVADSVGVT